ncbi:unnamed protein product [Parnassius mnemosyne]|uniref:[Histone H3]-lysine(4) N-trimethyltransferase n=1 Tax=Parnassius mnemosyne TaxID=213953 RepID=A0AAV1LST7_9NEOP
MDVPDEGVLDVDLLPDDGSDDEGEAPPSSDFYAGPGSTPTSCASSPRGEEPASPHGAVAQPAFFHHQPYSRPFFSSGRRGPGRPRKEGAKLAREGKIVRRYRGNPGSVRGAKRHRSSRDDALDEIMDEDDFTMPAPEDPPYMPEKWPGKICALCNLSEKSQLGQGEMRQITCNIEEVDGSSTPTVTNSGGTTPTSVSTPSTPALPMLHGLSSPPPEPVDPMQQHLVLPLSRRQKAFNKCKTPLYNMEHTDELSIIGYSEILELTAVVSSGSMYVHRCCLEFSPPFQEQVAAASNSDEDKSQLEEARVKGIVTNALSRKCAFCQRHGASIPCKMSCSKYFHLPCVLASGGFMDFHTKSSFCKDHLYQVPLVCTADIDCRTCRTIGDISNLMTCVTCGGHFHGTCVGLAQLPGVRAGWACRACRVCQVCRGRAPAGDAAAQPDARAVACEHCDKLYHAACLRPVMATVPKYGWKCKCCRVCSDCGARSPGAGPSSRWHAHYTVCDSCYQQRNKGSFCPLCRRAYRAAAYRDMIRCTACRRYVHGACDPEAEPQQYRQKKDQNPAYEYNCPICKAHMQLTGSKSGSFEDDSLPQSGQDSSYGDENSQEQDPLAIEPKGDVGLGKGKPFSVSSKVAKKKIGGYKLKGGYPPAGKLGFHKRQRSVLEFGRKRGSKPKMRGVFGVPGLGLQRPQAPDNKTQEDDPGVENKLVLCSSKDKFVLTQDLCVMCGAIGTDSEGCLIACAQCGQTYHPYCVNIKVSQVIVRQGWRCLDCTVCEGCGTRGDEALLVLCDDCDTAWHTYCARPQLGDVPRGAWRCERCRRCLVCGTRDTRAWRDNYTECAPCASLVMCCVCSEPYSDGELIIQCETCRRWLHASCDSIRNENDAEICCRAGYKCVMCRGREVPPPHVAQVAAAQAAAAAGGAAGAGAGGARSSAAPRLTAQALGLAGEYYVDDVCLSQRGAHHMKQLEADMGITHTRRKRRFKNDNQDKDAEIMASIETVVQNADNELAEDSKPDSTAEVKDEPGLSSNTNHKEGTLWNVANDGPPPEGFTVYTIESGLTVLRRKRQRNLNKLGIGGFVVRQRQTTVKAQADEEKDGDGTQASGESPSNKRKPRRKPRSKLMEQFPSYMQEAFFGKELLEPVKPAVSSTGNNPSESPGGSVRATTPEGYRELRDFKLDLENSDSEGEDVLAALTTFNDNDTSFVISLNTEEIELLNSLKPKEEKDDSSTSLNSDGTAKIKLENPEDGHLKHTEDSTALKNAILGPQTNESEQPSTATPENIPTVHSTKTETVSSETGGSSQGSTISPKDDLSLLGVNLDAMVRDTLPDMDGNDVDEIFKGVLTDDSQESQESSVSYVNSMASTPYSQQRQQLQSPMDYASPYHTEFGSSSNSALSPLFSECGSGGWGEQAAAPPPSYNQRSADKMRADESECPSPPRPPVVQLSSQCGSGGWGEQAAAPPPSYNQRSADKMRADESECPSPPRPPVVQLSSQCGSGGWGEQAAAPPPSYNQRSADKMRADESECPSPPRPPVVQLSSQCGSGGWGEQAAAPPPSYNQRSADKLRADESECPSPPRPPVVQLSSQCGSGGWGEQAAAPPPSYNQRSADKMRADESECPSPPRPPVVQLSSQCGSGGWGEQAAAPPPSYNQRSADKMRADESECPSPPRPPVVQLSSQCGSGGWGEQAAAPPPSYNQRSADKMRADESECPSPPRPPVVQLSSQCGSGGWGEQAAAPPPSYNQRSADKMRADESECPSPPRPPVVQLSSQCGSGGWGEQAAAPPPSYNQRSADKMRADESECPSPPRPPVVQLSSQCGSGGWGEQAAAPPPSYNQRSADKMRADESECPSPPRPPVVQLSSQCGSGGWGEQAAAPPPSYNQRSADKMRADESECPSPPRPPVVQLSSQCGSGGWGEQAAAPPPSYNQRSADKMRADESECPSPPRPPVVQLSSQCGSGGWGEQAAAPPPSYNQRSADKMRADESECPSPPRPPVVQLSSQCGSGGWGEQAAAPPPSYNQRSADKMRADESLGSAATISAVLYANTNHPEWKTEFPNWVDRCKQILKKWRALPSEQKAPYLQRARDNRSAIRMKKAQQEQERACGQQRSAREAEQERQWKQLQQMRQQQTQQQQQIIQDQRIQAAMQRMRAPDSSPPPGTPGAGSAAPAAPAAPPAAAPTTPTPSAEAPRSAFPAQRFPLHYATNDDINRQLRDLLQRHPDKMWPPQSSSEEGSVQSVNLEGQPFRQPLPVSLRPRAPLQPGQRPDHQLIMQQRIVSTDTNQMQQNIPHPVAQHLMDQKQSILSQSNANQSGDNKQDSAPEQGTDEMDMGDMDKLEQDAGNIGEVDILTGLGGEDDEALLESLTAEMGEQFNILEYADPELAALNDAHLLDGLELADDVPQSHSHPHAKRMPNDDNENKTENKVNSELQKAVHNIETDKVQVKSEMGTIKTENHEVKPEVTSSTSNVGQMFSEGVHRVITQNQQMSIQTAMHEIKSEIKLEGDEVKSEGEWRPVQSPQRPVFSQMFAGGVQRLQVPIQQQNIGQRPSQFGQPTQQVISQQLVQRAQLQLTGQHNMHFAQSAAASAHTQSIVSAMSAQVQAALAAGRAIAPGTRLLGADGAVGVVRHDRTVALATLPHSASGSVSVGRAPPPPPYPGTLRAPPPHPPPPYPQNVNQEQPLLLEELLEQEKREQEREGGEWTGGGAVGVASAVGPGAGGAGGASGAAGAGGAGPASAPPAVALFSAAPPPAPPAPPERALTEADQHARLLYEQWLDQYNTFAVDQLRYYETEVQKLRKTRKSLNSKQRQLRKSGNELMPNDAAALQQVSTQQQALQKHLEAARKQARQHSMLIQEYQTKQRQQNPQLAQQTVINQQQMTTNQGVFTQNQNVGQSQMQQQSTINRPIQIGLQGTPTQQQQTLIRTQQTILNSDGQPMSQQRIGLVTSPLSGQGRIVQGGRTLVIEQSGSAQQQLVRQLSGVQERAQFGQQQLAARAAMSPLHVQSPHAQSPHQLAPHSPLHHLASPMQSPLHSQPSPLHHAAQSPLHPSTQSPLHTQQSPLHSQQSPMHAQQAQQAQQAQNLPHQSPVHQSPLHAQQQMSTQHSPMHPQQSPMHPQQSPMHPQQSPMHPQQSPMHHQQSPMHSQQSPMHIQQSPMHTQQSPMQTSMSPQHFLQQLQAQRTSPQLPTPSRSPQIYQQSQIQSPVASHSPQLQTNDYTAGRFSRPVPGCSPLPTRFARPPQHQQGMRVSFGNRQQTSPLGSPQPLPSPGNTANEMTRQQLLQRQQYSPMGAAPASPSLARSPHVARTPTPSASPAASPAPAPHPAPHPEHGGGQHAHAAPLPSLHGHGGGFRHNATPLPPGYRYFKPGLFGGAPVWPKDEDRRHPAHLSKVSIVKRRTPPRQRFTGKTAAPRSESRTDDMGETSDGRKYVLYADGIDYTQTSDDSARMSFSKDDNDDEIEEFVEHLDDDDIVVVEPGAISPEERIATEEDFEELIDSGKPEDEAEEETSQQEKCSTRTETTTKTVAVISLATAKQPSASIQQYKRVNPSQGSTLSRIPVLSATVLSPHTNSKIINEVSQATVASVSIANQTISVPVLKNLAVPIASVTGHAGGPKPQIKKVPLNLTNSPLTVNMSSQSLSKPISSVISVISSNVPKVANLNPVITLATSNTGNTRLPVSILTQHQVKQKIVKTIEKPMALSLSNSKLSSLSVTHDVTLPAKIFQDEAASPDSTVSGENNSDIQNPTTSVSLLTLTSHGSSQKEHKTLSIMKETNKDIDIENEISQQTELPHTLCITDRTPLLLGKADIKSPDPIPEKIPDNIMEGDDEDKPEDNLQGNLLLAYNKSIHETPIQNTPAENKQDESVVKTIKAIANQTKEMVIDSNMQITSDMAQDSVQISIPSPTPSQERYLNDITMREHSEAVEGNSKHVETFEDMLCIFENIADDSKTYSMKHPNQKQNMSNTPNQNVNINTPSKQDSKEVQEQPAFLKREQEKLSLQSATVPQLSPLSQPAELTSNMANVSQQLRTIMTSLNTNTSKMESQNISTMRKSNDATTPTQVNFENLLPSSKVEVTASRPSPVQRIEKPTTSIQSSESMSITAAQMMGSRVNTLSSMSQLRKSPTVSPINSPVGMQNTLMKSPAQSPRITNQSFMQNEDSNVATVPSQVIQMPALSKIHSNSSAPVSMIHSNNTITTSVSSFQKGQQLPTSILGHTLLQPTRQINTSNLSFNSQNISSSQPPALVMTSRSVIGSKEPAPNVTVRTHAIVSPGMSQMQMKCNQSSGSINFITSSKLLHTQLTSPLKRSKSTDEPKSEVIVGHIQPTKRHSVESVIVKSEPMETDESNATASLNENTVNKNTQPGTGNQRNDESQNVLLKQLLQTTTSAATVVPQRTMTIQRTAPALGTIPSLEAQLARPSIPPPTLALSQEVDIPNNSPRHLTTVSSNFGNRPSIPTSSITIQTSIPTSSISPLIHTSTQSLMDVRKQPIKVMNKEETTSVPESSPTMKSTPIYSMNLENQQMLQTIKKEVAPPQQSPVHRPFTPMDVKKELLDESSQQSATSGVSTASDQGKLDQPMKEEYPESVTMDSTSETNAPETPSEAKKRKRREYQQKKRKQMQMNMKAAAENNLNTTNAKKRPRKGSRYEEDYDTFIDNLMTQLRLLPPMQIQEPTLTTNFAVCPLFGSGDLTKLKNKDYDILKGDLVGEFGNAKIPNVADYYNTKPFGDEEPLPEKPPASTQRGFYDQEFQPIIFDEDPEDKKLDFICKERDTDTPDSIISCSSPEGFEIEPANRFPGLRFIDDDDEEDDSDTPSGRVSPIIPLIAPIPIRVKPLSLYQLKDEDENQKSIKSIDTDSPLKSKIDDSPGSTESNENVTVTLTLTSGAAEDILGVLKELAGILHIPPPTSYQIIERTATPPSHKLGLYRSKGKDGKEGTPIDIQSILNGAAKFCRHCDVVILDSVVRAKASEFPLLSANKGNAEEILCDSDSELYFCSTQCYERFAWRPTNIILDGKSKTNIKDENKSDIENNLSKDRDDFDTASTESMETDDLDIKPDIKDEKMDLSFIDSLDNDELMKEVGDDVSALDEDLKSEEQDEKSNQSVEREKYRGIRYKAWSPGCIGPPVKYKRPTDRELTELVFKTGVAIMPVTNEDTRKCELCGIQGDGVGDGVSRLLNCDVDRWIHLNCALWSEGVYETVSGALMNVDGALVAGMSATCAVCRRLGATVRCFKVRCGSVYHLGCAVKDNCVFYKNKTAFCASHAPKNEKDNELTTLSVQRRVFVSRDEQRQVASVMLHSDANHLIRVGGLIFLSPGHLLPHQLPAFHTPNYIYPIGYKIVRFYWSMSRANSRCRYVCWISEEEGRPRFHVRAQDEARRELSAPTPRAAWAAVLDAVAALRENREEEGVLKLWPNYVTGEDLFGLTEPAVVRVLESLPGVETLTDYRFKFGRSALLEGGLAVNPSGCARCEARARCAWRRSARPRPQPPAAAHAPHAPPAPAPSPAPMPDYPACPYSKQFVHTKSSQYKKMKLEWRNNVYLARSKIQGLGLYAARDLEKHTMVIEYIGEIIRSELSEIREKKYEAKNHGIYMFRLDERRVVDATLSGGLARYINHSCQPNCVAETVEVDRQLRIIIFAKRRIARGEELAYDYKFDIEDDAHKIMCMCGAPNCRKWMN